MNLFVTTIVSLFLITLVAFSPANATTPASYMRNPGVMPVPPNREGEMQDLELRTTVAAGKEECFFQESRPGHTLELSYQVLESKSRFSWLTGAQSDMVIDFRLMDSRGRLLAQDTGQREGSHVHYVTESDTLSICFDNRRFRSGTKLVNMDIYLYSEEDDDRWGQYGSGFTLTPDPNMQDALLENMKGSLNRVRDSLHKVVKAQEERRAIEHRDRNVVELNFVYVNRFSLISIIVFLLVAIIQIILIRSFFENESLVKKGYNFLHQMFPQTLKSF